MNSKEPTEADYKTLAALRTIKALYPERFQMGEYARIGANTVHNPPFSKWTTHEETEENSETREAIDTLFATIQALSPEMYNEYAPEPIYNDLIKKALLDAIEGNKRLEQTDKKQLEEWAKTALISNVFSFVAGEHFPENPKCENEFNAAWQAYKNHRPPKISRVETDTDRTAWLFFGEREEAEKDAESIRAQGITVYIVDTLQEFRQYLQSMGSNLLFCYRVQPPLNVQNPKFKEIIELGRLENWVKPLALEMLRHEHARIKKFRQEAEAKAARLAARAEELPVLPMQIRVVANKEGAGFTRMPKVAAPISHLLSSGPLELARVDGETYAAEPEAAKDAAAQVLRPRSWDIVPKAWTETQDGRQLVIPGLLESEAGPVAEYLVATATNAAAAARGLPQTAPKLLTHMFACAPQENGAIVKGTLQQLTEQLNPGRRVQPRDRERTGAALAAIKSLRVVPNINGRARPMELFTVAYDLSKDPESMVGWCLNPFVADAMLGEGKTEEAGGLRRGFYLVNHSRLMAMDTKKPGLFPLYLRISGIWNDARYRGVFHPERVKPILVDELAYWMNSLPRTAAEHLQGRKHDKGRKDLSEARLAIIADLKALEKEGLIGSIGAETTKGKPWTVRPMPPADMLEAYKQGARGGGKDK